ncbi:hypothetical protein GCM10009096_33960 [Parasphingorhabdus litoris]|uniref:YD repeat-containing protein n=2 Tax=Parasphingorhabdus litoris TaxID=394733 RepID=A0ABP3KX00_9SPHN
MVKFFVILGLAFVTLGLPFPSATLAQDGPRLISYPAEEFLTSPGGVDMRTGRYVYQNTDLSIGAGTSELQLIRSMPIYTSGHANPFGNFSHNWDIFITEERFDQSGRMTSGGQDYRMRVHLNGTTLTFEGRQFVNTYGYKGRGPIARLVVSGDQSSSAAIYTMTAPDGTIITFRAIGNRDCTGPISNAGTRRCAFASRIVTPENKILDLAYNYNGALTGNRATLRSIRSSSGYALLFRYSGSRVTEACAVNLAVYYVPANTCPTGVAKGSYSYSNNKLTGFTDAEGNVSSFTYNGSAMGFVRPGDAQAWLVNTITLANLDDITFHEVVNRQDFADGSSYTYSWSQTPYSVNQPRPVNAGGSVTDSNGKSIHVEFEFPIMPGTGSERPCIGLQCPQPDPDDFLYNIYQQTPGPVRLEDQLGRVTLNDYCDPRVMAELPPNKRNRCAVYPLRSFTDPEGIKTLLEYDNYQNVTKATRQAKPGSGLANIVTSAAYGTTNPKTSTKPLWVIDANGNRTDFTYDPAHGGMLTKTLPADGNGIRSQTRYTYTQRYAWIKNSSGGYSRAAAPIWVLIGEEYCKTSAADANGNCTGGATDEVVTTYDYGPDSGPNNLLLRGNAITADGQTLRTCYTYDEFGRKTSETPPAANLASCS